MDVGGLLLTCINILISSAIGFIVWRLQRRIDSDEKKRIHKDDCMLDYNVMIVNTAIAGVTLGQVTACALRDGQANGELKEALEAASKVKRDYIEFITKQGIKNIVNLKG